MRTIGSLLSVHSGYLNTIWRSIYSVRAVISLQINLNTFLYGKQRSEIPLGEKVIYLWLLTDIQIQKLKTLNLKFNIPHYLVRTEAEGSNKNLPEDD